MKGMQWRLLVIHYQEVILPSIKDAQRRKIAGNYYRILAEIQWIVYGDIKMRNFRGIRLRLHVLCFLFNFWAKYLIGDSSSGNGLLYIHSIGSHFGDWFEGIDFKNSSTEAGEAFFAVLKRILLRYTNRTEDALLEVFVRLHYEHEVNEYCGINFQEYTNKISKQFQSFVLQELEFSPLLIQYCSQDLNAFIKHLISLGYKKETDFCYINSGALQFRTMQEVQLFHTNR